MTEQTTDAASTDTGKNDDTGNGDDGKSGSSDAGSGSTASTADQTVTVAKGEVDRLNAERAAADRARKRAEKALADRDEADQKAKGEFEQLAAKAQKERDEAVAALESERAKIRVSTIATRLNFRDPGDVLPHLTDDERASDQTAEAALKRLADEKPYLLRENTERRQSGNVGGGNGADDHADMNAMIRGAAGR